MESEYPEIDYEGISENLADENIELEKKLSAAIAREKVLMDALEFYTRAGGLAGWTGDREVFYDCGKRAIEALDRVKAMKEE